MCHVSQTPCETLQSIFICSNTPMAGIYIAGTCTSNIPSLPRLGSHCMLSCKNALHSSNQYNYSLYQTKKSNVVPAHHPKELIPQWSPTRANIGQLSSMVLLSLLISFATAKAMYRLTLFKAKLIIKTILSKLVWCLFKIIYTAILYFWDKLLLQCSLTKI